MKRARALSVAFVLSISGLLSAGQQNAAATQSRQSRESSSRAYTLHVDAEEVDMNCTVLDNKGELVNDLTKKDFKVFDDRIPQTVISLQHQDTPVSIGLLVDDSGSMNTKRAAVTSAALDLVRASNPQDETFVINFSDQAYLDQEFTSDLDKLQNGLTHLSLSGGTALYDTIVTAADKMEQSATRPRKVLIVVTDGDDNASRLTLNDAIRRVQDMRGPTIYSIGLLFGGNKSRHARHDLQALSNNTGGIAFFPSSLKDIDSVVAEIARDIRSQYVIAYRSRQTTIEGYHAVKIEVHAPGHGRLTIYSRSGYFSRQSSSASK